MRLRLVVENANFQLAGVTAKLTQFALYLVRMRGWDHRTELIETVDLTIDDLLRPGREAIDEIRNGFVALPRSKVDREPRQLHGPQPGCIDLSFTSMERCI